MRIRHIFLIWVLLGILAIPVYFVNKQEPTCILTEMTLERDPWEVEWDNLLEAIKIVESGNNPNATGKNGDLGILQITPILVKEVNRLGYNYKHEDALDIKKSEEMFYIIAEHYCPNHDYEKMARIWNGGPNGYKKRHTIKYWNKIKEQL